MSAPEQVRPPLSGRAVIYRCTRLFLLIILAGVLTKHFLFSAVRLDADQMEPALLPGDELLVLRVLRVPIIGRALLPQRGAAVVCRLPHQEVRGCLRVGGLSGDSLVITGGTFLNLAGGEETRFAAAPEDSVLPADYSPRDFMAPFRMPCRGESFALDSLSQRDFVLMASMYSQEHPRRSVDVKPQLFIDGIPSNDYFVANFLLYNGVFGSIPDSLDFDWFFWDRLRENLRYTLENRQVALRFGLVVDGGVVKRYRVGRDFAFLLADRWSAGYDSRFFGPLCVDRIEGRALVVLWSFQHNQSGSLHPRWQRFMTSIKEGPQPPVTMGIRP